MPPDAWLECLTERSNGDILITRYDTGEIFNVNPATGDATRVYKFPASANVNSSLGIAEYEDDVFAFNAGQITTGYYPIEHSWGIWSLDMRNWTAPVDNVSQSDPRVTQIAKMPNAGLLNGLTVLNPATTEGPRAKGRDSKPTIVSADAVKGVLYEIDIAGPNQTAQVFYFNPELLAPAGWPPGLNGVQTPPVRNPKHIYFTTGSRGSFYRIVLSQTSASVALNAVPELLYQGNDYLDDFAIEEDGTSYLSTSSASKIIKVSPLGEVGVLLESEAIAMATAALRVDRGGKKLLYVLTANNGENGGSPGKLVEVRL
ncbi:hypothetical protein N0V92_012024 [Colletotrichum tropicale]|nr:hypothetical protein N0V92_012024 [Colletotrichum tropicale]